MNCIILIGTGMIGTALITFTLSAASWASKEVESEKGYHHGHVQNVQLGPRFFSNQ